MITTRELHRLSQLRLSYWLAAVLFDWVCIVLAITGAYLLSQGEWWYWFGIPIMMVIIGSRQHALGIMGHEGAHRLACRNKWWNDTLTGLLCFWPMGFPLGGYRRFHFKHHQTVGTDDDPEKIHTRHRLLGQWRLPLNPLRLFRQIVLDLCGGSLPHLGMAARLTNAVNLRDRIGPMCMMILFLTLCGLLECWWILAIWFGSILTFFWIIFRLRIWTEHIISDEADDPTYRIRATWWQRFLFLPHNTYYHWEHHLYPQVPAHNLPRLRTLTLDIGPPILILRELIRILRGG